MQFLSMCKYKVKILVQIGCCYLCSCLLNFSFIYLFFFFLKASAFFFHCFFFLFFFFFWRLLLCLGDIEAAF